MALDIKIYMDAESKPGLGDIMRESTDQIDEPNRVCLLNVRRPSVSIL